MINFSDITKAVKEILESNIEVKEFMGGKDVIISEMINYDPNQVPWIGVYRGKARYEPRTLGSVGNWEGFPSLKIIVQHSDLISGEKCEEVLEGYVKKIIDAILEDTTLSGTVDIVLSYDVEQGYIETERSSVHFQGASITLNMEVATQ
ncbi:hypothetical protein KAR91_47705 [Candidatus Pacearchaeota archaeon]|nr:hypothetical protein [Candidatus Pacearchaeota archaeon]